MDRTPMTAEEIKALRLKLGLTQEDVAHKLGVVFPTWNRWERGHAKPSRLARRALARLAKEVPDDVA